MSPTREPDYISRRKDRDEKKRKTEKDNRDAVERKRYISALAALIKDLRRERREQSESERSKRPIERIAAIAAIIAAVLSAASLLAFWHLTGKANQTAESALTISANQLHMMQVDERPWLKVELRPSSEFAFNHFPDGTETASVSIRFTVTNVGKTPAEFVTLEADMHDGWLEKKEIGHDQAALCAAFNGKKSPADTQSATIFPGQWVTFQETYAIKASELKMVRAEWGKVAKKFPGVVPVVYGCVGYKTTIDALWRQTDFMYAAAEPQSVFLDPTSGDVKQASMVMIAYTLAPNGFFAN